MSFVKLVNRRLIHNLVLKTMLYIMSTSNASTFNLRSLLEKKKLNGANFIDWYRNLRIVLKLEKINYVAYPIPKKTEMKPPYV
jgi:hypothetical protein